MANWTKSIECPRCQGSMEVGFVIDETHGRRVVPKWVAGVPKMTWWMGLRLGRSEQVEISTYRCRRCGYLESYA